ncbi:MAG TPA: response regulator transcription factor [Candidatus Corynebacterium avicola]|uniref:Response regulator transcription factor n=1 Tax=Candidatus Corynebacterium avicola TaxID=2838527 RepID=A0A9D1RSB0_9CORY|nr:response regulator transcription factor [Candidatus Corynebacterium avicola]
MIRVLLADDHHIVRMGLRAVLESADDIEIVGEVDTADGAVQVVQRIDVDVVLMDLRFGPGTSGHQVESGAQATERIRALDLDNSPNILVVTNYDSDGDILGAVEAGAVGYLLKDAPPEELIVAVRNAAEGTPAMSGSVADRLENRDREAASSLSAREIEVLREVANGKSNRQIGTDLFLSEATVKSHLVHIYNKMGVRSRTSAVAAARDAGIL